MSQFPGFPSGASSDGDVGMTEADDESSSVSRTAEHFGSSLRISPPALSIPNPTNNYFAVTAAYFPSQLPSNASNAIADKTKTSGHGNSLTTAVPSQPVAPSASVLPAATESATTNGSFAAPQPPAEVLKPKPQPRNKVPLEKGYSQMVWLRTMQTEHDLAGLKGQSRRRLISMDEIKQHKSPEAAWTVLRGRVYNITPYLKFHPGGDDMLMKAAGKDCTALFRFLDRSIQVHPEYGVLELLEEVVAFARMEVNDNDSIDSIYKYHAWVNAEFLLEKCMVGLLDVPQ